MKHLKNWHNSPPHVYISIQFNLARCAGRQLSGQVLNALPWVAARSDFAISESPGKLWEVCINAVWPRCVCTCPDDFLSAHSHLCCLSPSSSLFLPVFSCHTSDIPSSSIYQTSNVRQGSWNRRVWNMKQSYVSQLNWVRHLWTRKPTLWHIRVFFSLKCIACTLEVEQTCWILRKRVQREPTFILIHLKPILQGLKI